MQACNTVTRNTAHAGEITPHQDLAVKLHRRGADISIGIGVETVIQAAVRVQACSVVTRSTTHAGEIAPHQDFAIKLYRHGANISIGIGVETIFA